MPLTKWQYIDIAALGACFTCCYSVYVIVTHGDGAALTAVMAAISGLAYYAGIKTKKKA